MECPGCGLRLVNQPITVLDCYNASSECYQKYSELRSYTIAKQDIDFIHQHAIDTYSAQHSGKGMKPITTAFSLIGLYYAVEKGYTGRQVQRIHTLLSCQKYYWPEMQAPDHSLYSLIVVDVLNEMPGENRDKMIQKWMSDVWACWNHQHNCVKEICQTLLK